MRRTVTFLFLSLIYFGGVTSLRDVRLRIEPPVVVDGETATLICSRDMQDSPIYTVKWYRGTFEFYRYVPHSNPGDEIQMFAAPGITVDLNRSNGTQVFLKRLNLSLTGNFTCEVTTEFPYSTQTSTVYLDIVAIPKREPVLKADKERYFPGDILTANCTCFPSKPAANLTIFLNGNPIQSSQTSFLHTEQGLVSTKIAADLKVTTDMFKLGRLRLKCVATIYEVYTASASQDFLTPENDPRTERITSNAVKSFHNWILLFLLMLLPVMVLGEEDYTFNENEFGDFAYYDEDVDQNAFLSLLGG